MKFKNTSYYQNNIAIKEMINFVNPLPKSFSFDIWIKKGRANGFGGRAYCYKGKILNKYHHNPYVVIRLPNNKSNENYPLTKYPLFFAGKNYAKEKDYIGIQVFSLQEGLITILAHELRHLWQAKYPNKKRLYSYGQFSEKDADIYALQQLRKWRIK